MSLTRYLPTPVPVEVPTGTAVGTTRNIPILFHPIRIRGLELQNRIVVSPMGTWSAEAGHLTDFHLVHYGDFALRGAGLTIVEVTAVTANGRSSPHDSGLWEDSQIAPLKRVVDFIHKQGQKAGIQLGHCGRKAGMQTPKLAPEGLRVVATEGEGGWPDDIWAPSPISYSKEFVTPKVMAVEQIEAAIQSFADAARRAIQAGVDFLEIHAAHGYLIHQFLSPLSNQRSDDYGGSFENRTRFLRRIIEAIRSEIPDSIPLSVRISATDWMEWSGRPSWDLNQSIRLAKLLPGLGVDLLDVSSGGSVEEQRIDVQPTYQIDLAAAIRHSLQQDGIKLLIAAVGLITSPEIANNIVQTAGSKSLEKTPQARLVGGTGDGIGAEDAKEAQADLVFVGRQFLREPSFALRCAQELSVNVAWPYQYERAKPRSG